MLFEPGPEDADMFFANIFSYGQRKRLCALAFEKTRRNLLGARGCARARAARATASRCATSACAILRAT